MISGNNSIHGFFITYHRLMMLNKQQFGCNQQWGNCSNIDIFIDMNSATKELFYNRPPENGGAEVASSILNLCGHYREYYRRFHQCETRFFIIYSINRPANCVAIFDEYNSKNIMTQMGKPTIYNMITNACSYLDAICKYIPDVFFIYSDYETSTTIYDIIERRENKSYPSLVISKDPLAYEIIAFSQRSILARPRKMARSQQQVNQERVVNTNDHSEFYSHNEILPVLMSEHIKNVYPEWRKISPSLISFIYALYGVSNRNIPMLLNMKETLSTISKGIEFGDIANNYEANISHLYNALNIGGFGVDEKSIINRFQMLDLITQQAIMQRDLSIGVDDYAMNVVNLHDPDRVRYINNTEFKNCPVILENF